MKSLFSVPHSLTALEHIFCHMNLFVHASGSGIIGFDAQSILGSSQSTGNCAPSQPNTVHERPEWMMNPSISVRLLECYKSPGSVFSFPFCICGKRAGAAVMLKGRGDNWSWLFWCEDNAIIRLNHIKGTLLGQQGPSSYSQDIGNVFCRQSEHAVKSNMMSFQIAVIKKITLYSSSCILLISKLPTGVPIFMHDIISASPFQHLSLYSNTKSPSKVKALMKRLKRVLRAYSLSRQQGDEGQRRENETAWDHVSTPWGLSQWSHWPGRPIWHFLPAPWC